MRRAVRLAVISVAGAAAITGLALGEPSKRPILHEDLPPPAGDKPTPMIGAAGSGNPAAFTAGNKVLPKPIAERPGDSPKSEPVLGKGGFAADRWTTMKPDGNTGPDSTLHYVSVFNPDVLPFKRMSSLDSVAEDYTLKVAHTALSDLAVGGSSDRTRDRFWGSVLVQLTPGTDIPLPSVAPDMRILSYEIKPTIAVRFEKDGADNFYVRTDESSAAGTYRLIFLADADAGYFAPALPTSTHYTPRIVAAMTPPELRPNLPDSVRKAANRTLDKLALDDAMDLGVAFNKLVAYFRAFQAKPLPPSSGDIYRDLCDSQAGVCRHRSFAFMVTANALGLPTRLVENEAHAFVEVWFPERRWQRIDLGGAALRMDVTGADNKTLHRPRADDPFAKPPEYTQSYTQLEGDIKGLTQQQIDDKHKRLDQSPASGSYGESTGSGGGLFADRITPNPKLPAATQDPRKATPTLDVTIADASAYRGDQLHLEGRVHVGARPLADHTVEVFLAPVGDHARSVSIGHATTAADGTFKQDFQVPAIVDPATYDVVLSSSEDAYYNAALSE